MNIYLNPPQPSRGLQRIADALARYKPEWAEVVNDEREADLVVIYAIGRREKLQVQVERFSKLGIKYAVIQVCLRSTMSPETQSWRAIWDGAEVVWSYYDLNQAIKDDAFTGDPDDYAMDDFYHAPLGADAGVFVVDPAVKKLFTVATSGLSRLSESVRECWLAAQAVDGRVFHAGPRLVGLSQSRGVLFSDDCNDNELAATYQQCEFVSGLRRKEGFELPAVEGLLCGARPVLFDSADYRHWYEPWGEFIQETDRQGVVDQLVELFKRGARPVSAEEIAAARLRFDWETIVGGFYERLGN